jgi:flotillin
MFGYRVPAPNEALLISGKKSSNGADGPQFRIVIGHGAYVLPVFRKASILSLAMQEAVVTEQCPTHHGINLQVSAVIAYKVGKDPASVAAAAERFLSDQSQMDTLTGQIFAGHLRSIVGSMTVEDIIRERQKLSEAVLGASKLEMANLGLVVDSLQIQKIDDMGSQYIEALSKPQRAAVAQAAQIAEAEATRAAVEAQQESARRQAEYAQATAVAKATYQASIDRAEQESRQAGPLAAAQAQQAVLEEQAKVALKTGQLRQAQLVAEVIKPAEADAERVLITARADAQATELRATAAASNGRIALEQRVIDQVPELIRASSEGLKGSNLTVLNGAEGVTSVAASLVGQGTAVLRSVLDGLNGVSERPAAGGTALEGGPAASK